jgi:hypothetical protein
LHAFFGLTENSYACFTAVNKDLTEGFECTLSSMAKVLSATGGIDDSCMDESGAAIQAQR